MTQQATANLEDGFYWVRLEEHWMVSEKTGDSWCLFGDDWDYGGLAFDEIDPRPIKREE